MASDCKQTIDPLKLLLEGARQDRRFPAELNPAHAPVDERRLEHALVFAQTYSRYLQFYGPDNTLIGDWNPFFSRDVSAQLAVAAIEDVDFYKSNVKTWFDFLNNRNNKDQAVELKQRLGWLFGVIATLAMQLERLKEELPAGIGLKETLRNLIRGQLASELTKLVAYYEAFPKTDADFSGARPNFILLGAPATVFGAVYSYPFSEDWITTAQLNWNAHLAAIAPDASVYGASADVFERINHIATHNLFTVVFDRFLKVYARAAAEARDALRQTLTGRDDHEPHYALLLAFLRLFDDVRAETNTLTGKHLDFYYRQILRLKEKPAQPGQAHLLVELARQAESYEIAEGVLFKAGKDKTGVDTFFANNETIIANQGKVTALKNLYRHGNADNDYQPFANGRLYAAPVANSDDGLGAKLTSPDLSWQPFFNKRYDQGVLIDIDMPKAEIGFALASHYLLLAEGVRTITLKLTVDNANVIGGDRKADVSCRLSGEKGWVDAEVTAFTKLDAGHLNLIIHLDGSAPPVTPYSAKIHGYGFATELPVLLVKLAHRTDKNTGADFLYPALESVKLTQIDMTVNVAGLKTLALSNDFGPVDAAKPFQPFGATPAKNSSLVIGSKEAFQKQLSSCAITIQWQNPPAPYSGVPVKIGVEFLQQGQWQPTNLLFDIAVATPLGLPGNTVKPFVDAADLTPQEPFNTSFRHGYLRLSLNNDFGQSQYEQALITYIGKAIKGTTPNDKPIPPVAPSISQISLSYTASQSLPLASDQQSDFDARTGRFFHLAPFGQAEQHRYLKTGAPDTHLYLLPQFKHLNSTDKKLPDQYPVPHEAECYIGVSGLKPPQNLALFFQVADGTADPLSVKPKSHLHWSYLRNNEWLDFAEYSVQDTTSEWLHSGIITLAIPDDASADNSLLPAGQFWLRAAVAKQSDAVCRLQKADAQGLTATFKDQGNDPAFPAATLPAGGIAKLDIPNAAVKSISQPFPSFGGRGAEQADAFYTRVSERLRHKDRAIALWDYEHLLLEAFPQIYQAKCLNHTCYKPDDGSGNGIYRELAPGHVTVVTIPNQEFHNLRDPLRPYASLGVLQDIETFIKARLSCFVELHVRNPLFEEVAVAFNVRFHDDFDATYYQNKLNEAIVRFLSPWAFPGGGSPTFGGKIYQAVLLNFVEEQPYVDYVTDFKLSHRYQAFDANGLAITVVDLDLTEIEGSKAVSLLVSARQHAINVINPAQQQAPGATCPCASV